MLLELGEPRGRALALLLGWGEPRWCITLALLAPLRQNKPRWWGRQCRATTLLLAPLKRDEWVQIVPFKPTLLKHHNTVDFLLLSTNKDGFGNNQFCAHCFDLKKFVTGSTKTRNWKED